MNVLCKNNARVVYRIKEGEKCTHIESICDNGGSSHLLTKSPHSTSRLLFVYFILHLYNN